jgi:GH15 family glucan-1,4-alpha-glucosidase
LQSCRDVRRIEDYALLGDLQTAALVDRTGSIDWCCFPRFDSAACFAALVGDRENGCWHLAPAGEIKRHERRYRHDTLILESTFETAEGRIRAIDFMPPREAAPDIVRIVEGVDGSVPVRSELVVRFDYGLTVPWVHRIDGGLLAVAGPDAVAFRTPAEARDEGGAIVAELTLEPGQKVAFVLTWFPSHDVPPEAVDADEALADTQRFWSRWAGACEHDAEYHDEMHRSLLVLKALTYAPTGGIVAAPTTSLPERVGGERNWDYRFCWLRDASMTLIAMLNAGYRSEAQAWHEWLLRAVAGDAEDVQIMYGSPASAGWTSGSSSGCPASSARGPSASGTKPSRSSSSTSTESLSTPRTSWWRTEASCRRSRGRCCASCSSGSRTAGARRTRASGRFAARAGASRTRRSWPGSRSTGPSGCTTSGSATGRWSGGARSATRFTPTSC